MNGAFAWVLALLSFIPGLGTPAVPGWNGYVEDDYTYAAAPTGGLIARLAVSEGETVKAGDVLFVLETSQQQAQYDAMKARADAAEATLVNLQTGSRKEEVDVARASLDKAMADRDLAQQNLSRSEDLFAKGLKPQAQLDRDKASIASAQAAVDQLKAQLRVAELPARDAQQIAAEATLAAARADVANARAALDDRTVMSPADSRVERLFFKAGEVVGAGMPVVALSGSDAMKVLFYLNEGDRPQFALGDIVAISCDGCAAGLTARISHFASDPQFTPPIIYSRDERNRLVFLTEAILQQQNGILPGQPVSIGRIQ